MATADLGIHDLEKTAGVPMRTLRHWVKKGVLPRPRGSGQVARYTEVRLLRAQVIKHLRVSKLSLREINRRIGALSNDELPALLPAPVRPDEIYRYYSVAARGVV